MVAMGIHGDSWGLKCKAYDDFFSTIFLHSSRIPRVLEYLLPGRVWGERSAVS